MLNLEWFRTFKVVYEVGTLSAAAQSLFISQPGVSLHLSALESYTGYRLFERKNRGVIPTDRGTLLYNYIIGPMIGLEEIEKLCYKKSKTSRATVSVGMCFTTFHYTLEEHVGHLPFNLITKFGECAQLLNELNAGVIDFVITSQTPPLPNLVYTPFMTTRNVLVCGGQTDISTLEKLIIANHPEPISDWLGNQVWFATSADMEAVKRFWQVNFEVSPDFKPSFVLPHYGSILRNLKSCNGFAVVPDFVCKHELANGTVKLAWEGSQQPEDMLHFAKRKNTSYPKELLHLENLLTTNGLS
ncbi:LysR family transcriptional regulator [Dyadobacter sp. LJ419]|uniref:LysR family transcriptional regulator n=1 Tax=Dyadobacter chenwenxiniae TaxID=2906456 RepID=A0A9X1PT66_9BACT|nr:LysR family transcriptional regulator [Dyadobacter chenwenxiniae]MCF0065624.1 LysR family transcriptional regulator [Dyadobacter chenwenxiniae]